MIEIISQRYSIARTRAGTSDKYILAPTAKAMLSDQITMVQNLRTKMCQKADQFVKREKNRKDEEERRRQINVANPDAQANADLVEEYPSNNRTAAERVQNGIV